MTLGVKSKLQKEKKNSRKGTTYNMHVHMLYFRSVLFIPKLDNTRAIMEKSEANFQLCMAFFPANWRNEHALPRHGPHFISWKSNTSDARNKFKWLKNVSFSEE